MGQGDVVFHGEYPDDDDGKEGHDGGELIPKVEERSAYMEDNAARYAGHGIDFFSEDERHLVDEHVAHHTARGTSDTPHDDGHPERLSADERLLNAGNSEQAETESVEDEPGVVKPHKVFFEDYDNDECNART